MSKPLVSIIIPNYNGYNYLESSLISALNQDYKNLEIIVVDDGSSDNSKEIINKFQSQIKAIYLKHQGASQSRNVGIENSGGEFVALLDSDDIWLPNKISKQIEVMNLDNADFAYCGYEKFGAVTGVVLPNEKIRGDVYPYFRRYPGVNFIGSCSGVIFRKSLLESSGLFDLEFTGVAEDWDFFRRYSKFGRFTFSDDVLYRYRKHDKSLSAKNGKSYFLGNKLAVLKLITSDDGVSFFSNRLLWLRLHSLFVKSFLSQQSYKLALQVFLGFFRRIQ